MRDSKSAIALLITIMFVIVITVAIGIGLKQVNTATAEIKKEKFMYQSTLLIEDVLKILKTNKELANIVKNKSVLGMSTFLSQTAFMPFESSGLRILLSIKSARGKFNLNNLTAEKASRLKYFIESRGVNSVYVDMLLDNIGGIKVDDSYNTNIFDENPYLFRDYIGSIKHLHKINDFYRQEYNDNSLKNINFNTLFYLTKQKNTRIDLNHASADVWQMMLVSTKERALELSKNSGFYKKIKDLNLDNDEKFKLSKFKTSFFEPYILVSIEIIQKQRSSKIIFEYDIKNKKGSHFVYEI